MTHLPPTHPGPIVCGQRETRTDGNYECIRPPEHPDQAHYWVRLSQGAT